MSIDAPAKETVNETERVTHADLEANLRKLMRLKAEFAETTKSYELAIKETEEAIERQTLAVFPGIDDGCAFWDGDPIEFLAGKHRVSLCRIRDHASVEIERTHTLDVSGDLFSEKPEEVMA